MPPKDRHEYRRRPHVQQKSRDYDQQRAEQKRWNQRKSCTGFTRELFERVLEHQDHACAICRGPFGGTYHDVCRDHEHGTKPPRPRGILCMSCNVSLGHYERKQRQHGLVLAPYELYLKEPPVLRLRS